MGTRPTYIFHQRLQARFGDMAKSFSEPLTELLFGLWEDGVKIGRVWPKTVSSENVDYSAKFQRHFGERSSKLSPNAFNLLISFWNDALSYGKGEMCDSCGSHQGVQKESSRTLYTPTADDPDPNVDIPLCRECALEHHAYWDDMWREYHNSQR